jgi:flagellar hook-associated protein 2
MGSPVTLSGFNNIDFSVILNAVMQQESQPLTTLQAQQKSLQSRSSTYGTLGTKLSTFETAVTALTDAKSLLGRTASNTNETAVRANATATAAPGIYDIVVQELARAQVMASASTTADADTTVVAWGGTLTIGGVAVAIDAPVTLSELAERINSTKDVGVTATVVKSGAAAWQLVLTGKSTGTAAAFTVASTLTGGSGVSFLDTDNNGLAGDSIEDNAVSATDARALVNNVQVVNSTNTLDDVISGVTLTLLKKDAAATSTLTISEDLTSTKAAVQKVVDAYNDFVKFAQDQLTAAGKGDQSSVARDPLLRSLRFALRNALTSDYEAGGEYASLATVGLTLDTSGRLNFSSSKFETALVTDRDAVVGLLTGDGTTQGAFPALVDLVKSYTKSDGLLRDTRSRLDEQVTALTRRISDLAERLAVRRASLQREYIAADMTMTQLNSSSSSLSSLGGQYRLF